MSKRTQYTIAAFLFILMAGVLIVLYHSLAISAALIFFGVVFLAIGRKR